MGDARRRAGLAFAMAGLAAVAAAGLFLWRVRQVEAALGGRAAVVVAAVDIPALAVVTPDMLAVTSVPGLAVLPGAFDRPAAVAGQVARVPLPRGHVVVAAALGPPEAADPDLRRITLAAGERLVLEPDLVPGDRVDVIASFHGPDRQVTMVYLAEAPVVRVAGPDRPPAVTLQVSLEDARRLAWAENYGRQLRLVRRPTGG